MAQGEIVMISLQPPLRGIEQGHRLTEMSFVSEHLDVKEIRCGAPSALRPCRQTDATVHMHGPMLWGSTEKSHTPSVLVAEPAVLVAKVRNRKWRLISRTCCPPPAAALRATQGACGAL